jgi:hypothetical protein
MSPADDDTPLDMFRHSFLYHLKLKYQKIKNCSYCTVQLKWNIPVSYSTWKTARQHSQNSLLYFVEYLTVVPCVKKFTSVCRNRRYITVFTCEPTTGPYSDHVNPLHTKISCFLKVNPDWIQLLTVGSLKFQGFRPRISKFSCISCVLDQNSVTTSS